MKVGKEEEGEEKEENRKKERKLRRKEEDNLKVEPFRGIGMSNTMVKDKFRSIT
jgi:hypothetical protein